MIPKVVYSNQDAVAKIRSGVDKLYQAVSSTLGPGGGNVLITIGNQPQSTKDGVTVAESMSSFDAAENTAIAYIKMAAKRANDLAGDGPQPLYSKILTPNGWVEFGSLKVGDVVCGTNGSIQEVEGIYPKGSKEIFQIIFNDGRVVECCEDRLWTVTTN